MFLFNIYCRIEGIIRGLSEINCVIFFYLVLNEFIFYVIVDGEN